CTAPWRRTEAMAETSPSRVSYDFVTSAIARTLGNPGKGYYALLALAVALLGVGIVCLLFLLRYGLGLAGYSHPVYWAVYITCFVFWVGIAHSGTLISAILFLFRSGWRTAVYRTAEAMTVFAVMTAGLFPLIHIGRQWYFYWLIPYPNERGLWPNFKSPLIWDEFAIGTYFTVSTVFLIMGLVPDIAAARDVVSGWRKRLYAITSLGWRGTNEQWWHYTRGGLVPGFRTVLVGVVDDDHLQRLLAAAPVVQADPHEHPGAVRDFDLREHRHVVRALCDHCRVARGGAVRAVRERHLQPDLGGLGNHGRPLRRVRHALRLFP